MTFPRDLPRFLYWIFFKPFSLYAWIQRLDPTLTNAALLLRSSERAAQPLKQLALFYILLAPWLLGLGAAALLSQLGMEVSAPRLIFYLAVAMALSLTFSLSFAIAFLLPFSVMVAVWSSLALSSTLGILFSLMLGLAYGLTAGSARWGLTAGLVYGAVFAFLLGPQTGLAIGAAFLIGFFRILFYAIEAPLSWVLGIRASSGNAHKLWKLHPVLWDELIWLPLPMLDRHLQALRRQDETAAQEAIHHVQKSFRQGWAAKSVAEAGVNSLKG